MISSDTNNARRHGSWIKILLFPFALLLLTAVPARAQSAGGCVANFGGVIDGFVNPVPPSQINIDGNCTIQNFPASNPLTSNISFAGTGRGWLVIFNNVRFIGNMSCDKVHGNFIWFVNGSTTTLRPSCQNLFVPVDKIDKENPPGPPFVSIGAPFTYTLTFPQLVNAITGVVVNPNGSNAEVDQVTVTDNLNATGVSLSYVNSSAAWKGSGAPVGFTVTNASGLLTFSSFPPIPAGQQIVLSVTVVLNNAVPPNSPGTQFSNTASWTLGTTIGGTFHFPLPGEQGVSSPPLTIAAPNLVFTKSGPSTMNPGQLGQFTLNVQNTGNSDAWNATIVDKLPTGATGGMCTATPQILSAQVFQADGVTPVPGKGPLAAGTDYTFSYAGAPACTLTLNMLSAAAVIGSTQRLVVTYQTQLDANTQKGITLTNVAGATQWYNGPSSNTGRQSYACTLTNGTPGVLDCQDAHTVTVPISALTLTKGGPSTMYLGQLGRLALNVQNTGTTDAGNATILDKLPTGATGGMCTATPQILSAQVFQADGVTTVPGKAAFVAGTDYTLSYAGAPACTLTLKLLSAAAVIGPTQRLIVTYQTQLDANTQNGATLTNVAGTTLWYNGPSGDTGRQSYTCTLTNGTPGVLDCQDAHTVTAVIPAVTISKQVTAVGGGAVVPGGQLDYLVHVTNTSANPVNPVVITDNLNAAGAGALTYVAGSATMNNSPNGVSVAGNVITANYSTTYGPLAPGGTIDLRFRATLGSTLAAGTIVTNTGIVTWNTPPQTASGSVSITIAAVANPLTITKQVSVVGGGAAVPGATLDYLVH